MYGLAWHREPAANACLGERSGDGSDMTASDAGDAEEGDSGMQDEGVTAGLDIRGRIRDSRMNCHPVGVGRGRGQRLERRRRLRGEAARIVRACLPPFVGAFQAL
ncbi:hypothetical protein MRX96_035587 [Rhipicephalus microplus]